MAEYIDKQAFLERMKKADRYFMVKFDIESFPAAEVEPVRHAKWEANKSGYLACTNCAWERRWIPLVEHYPRCPNCGAWMDGGAENG